MKNIMHGALILLMLLLVSCNKFDTHPYIKKIDGKKDINHVNINKIQANYSENDTVSFAVISDSHVQYDNLVDLVNVINNANFDFVIHCGDQTDYGLVDEFLDTREIMCKLKVPYIMLLGNHDCLGTGRKTYAEIYGATDFSFTAGTTKFVCLNTNCLEYHNSNNIPDFDFIENEILTNSSTTVVVAMHVEPWDVGFNHNKIDEFESKIIRFGDSVICIYGHLHDFPTVIDYFGDGVKWYHCPKLADRYYLSFKIYKNIIEYEAVKF